MSADVSEDEAFSNVLRVFGNVRVVADTGPQSVVVPAVALCRRRAAAAYQQGSRRLSQGSMRRLPGATPFPWPAALR